MSGRYYETETNSRHDRHDDAAWFHHQPNAGTGNDTFVRESMTLTHTRPRSPGPPHNDTTGGIVTRRSQSRSRSRSRAHSPDGYYRSRAFTRSRSRSRSISRTRSAAHTPIDRARGIVEDNFTSSTTGIGASIIGAVVGGFVANRASEALQAKYHKPNDASGSSGRSRRHDSHHGHDDTNVPRLASTILGAVAGGLGANALANHMEDQRDGSRGRDSWQRRYSREEYDYRRSSRGRGYDDEEEEYDFVHDAAGKHERRHKSRDSGYRD